jgi:hypothetical protein
MYDIYNDHLPIGFSMALSNNKKAFYEFLNMDDACQDEIISKAKSISNQREMYKLVEGIVEPVNYISN